MQFTCHVFLYCYTNTFINLTENHTKTFSHSLPLIFSHVKTAFCTTFPLQPQSNVGKWNLISACCTKHCRENTPTKTNMYFFKQCPTYFRHSTDAALWPLLIIFYFWMKILPNKKTVLSNLGNCFWESRVRLSGFWQPNTSTCLYLTQVILPLLGTNLSEWLNIQKRETPSSGPSSTNSWPSPLPHLPQRTCINTVTSSSCAISWWTNVLQ